jgi:hypothetical protein
MVHRFPGRHPEGLVIEIGNYVTNNPRPGHAVVAIVEYENLLKDLSGIVDPSAAERIRSLLDKVCSPFRLALSPRQSPLVCNQSVSKLAHD